MKEDADLGVAAPEDGPWRDQLLEAETALGGRFESKEDVDLGVLAREDGPWLDQLLAGDATLGGRFEPKFIPVARVPAAIALTSELPSLRPAVALILRGPFEPAMWPPKYAELLFARVVNPPNLLDEPSPVCRGTVDRTLRKLLPPECPPPPPWNPPPPLLPLWNPPPPREPPPCEPPPLCEPPP